MNGIQQVETRVAALKLRASQRLVPVTGVDAVIAALTPHRRAIVIGNTDLVSPMWIALGQKATVGGGLLLQAATPFYALHYPEDGNGAALELHAIATLTASNPGQQVPFSAIAAQSSTAAAGTNDSFTVPAGQQGWLTAATASNFVGGAPTVALQLTRGANTITLLSGTGPLTLSNPVALQAGDVIKWVTTTGVAATTVDFGLFGYTQTLAGTVPTSVNAVLWDLED